MARDQSGVPASTGRPPGAPDTTEPEIEWEDPSSLPVEAVRQLFLTLSKTLRSYQLYDRTNPVFLRFVGNLRDAFGIVWNERDDLQILIEEDRFLWLGEEVYREENRSASLAFLIYRDGIRALTFRRGLEGDELEEVLDVLHRMRSARQQEDDLVTLLWDLDLTFLDYSAVDLLPEGTLLRAGPEDTSQLDPQRILEEELGADPTSDPGDAEAASQATILDEIHAIRPEDFNPTLYAMDAREKDYLESEYRREMARDMRTDVLAALFDRLEDPAATSERQEEVVSALQQLLPTFLSQSALRHAAILLGELEGVRARHHDRISPRALREAESLLEDFSSPDSVRELVRSAEESETPLDQGDLELLLRHLRPAALGPLLARTEQLSRPETQEAIRSAMLALARGEEDRISRFLSHSDPGVVAGAVRLMGALGHKPAAPRLAELLESGSAEVQQAVLEAARRIPATVLAEALEGHLGGDRRDLRMGAARVIADIHYTPARATLQQIVEGRDIRGADLSEQMAMFSAYADLAKDDAVPVLDRILNHRSLLGRRDPPELRACAALALGRIGGVRALNAVRKSEGDDEPAVRTAVRRALSGGTGPNE